MIQKVTVFKYHIFFAKREIVVPLCGEKVGFLKKASDTKSLYNATSSDIYYIKSCLNYMPTTTILTEKDIQDLIEMEINVTVVNGTLNLVSKMNLFLNSKDVKKLKDVGFSNWEEQEEFAKKLQKGVYHV
jgi:hypothetical protein